MCDVVILFGFVDVYCCLSEFDVFEGVEEWCDLSDKMGGGVGE